jgi:hypothetical protein
MPEAVAQVQTLTMEQVEPVAVEQVRCHNQQLRLLVQPTAVAVAVVVLLSHLQFQAPLVAQELSS